MPEISVIIPTFNRAQFLGETLDSIIAQSFENWECLVIDDGSADYTIELLEFYKEKDARIFYYKRPASKPKGANACRNYGFELSKGDFINWFDSDDLMHPQKLELQMKSLKSSGRNYSICYSEVLGNDKNKTYKDFKSQRPFLDYLKMKIKWLTQAPLWDKEFLIKNNLLFDEELQAAQEWEFHCKALYLDSEFDLQDRELVFIRRHGESISYNPKNNFREFHYFLARLKIYQNTSIDLETETRDYLKNYLYSRFKAMVRSRNRFVIKAYQKLLLRDDELDFGNKLNALLGIFSFKLTGKGDRFLNGIHNQFRSR